MTIKIDVDERFLKVYEAYGVSLSNPLIGIESLQKNSVYQLKDESETDYDSEWIQVSLDSE